MNYNALIQRSKDDKLEGNCNQILDGISGLHFSTDAKTKRRIRQEELDSALKTLAQKLADLPDRANEDWEYDEIFVVYTNMKEIRGTKLSKITAVRTGIQLSRTLGAINWCNFHLFSDRTDLHRSIEMINFRKEFGLDKGDKNEI